MRLEIKLDPLSLTLFFFFFPNNKQNNRPFLAASATNGKGEQNDKNDGDDVAAEGERLTVPVAGADADWREFRARLVRGAAATTTTMASEEASSSSSSPSTSSVSTASTPLRPTFSSSSSSSSSSPSLWAHPLGRPEKGCVLVAHPLLFTSTQTYFSRSVVFLIEHSDDGGDGGSGGGGGGGTAGLILNKPTTLTLSDVGGGVSSLLPEFADATLHLGGDVERSSLHVLHPVASLQGSLEVVSGVRVGGVDAAARAVRSGEADADDFKFYHGYCGWAPGQLEREFRSGVWFAAAASKEVILGALSSFSSPPSSSSLSSPSAASPLSSSSSPAAANKKPAPTLLSGEAMWHGVLELMGGEHAEMSRALRASSAGGGGGGGGGSGGGAGSGGGGGGGESR